MVEPREEATHSFIVSNVTVFHENTNRTLSRVPLGTGQTTRNCTE
jgi:hypothetical protein